MRKLFFFFLFLFVLGACKQKVPVLKFQGELEFSTIERLSGEVCNNTFFFNYPQDLFILDSLLILHDKNNEGVIHIFSKDGVHKKSGVQIGRGPGEVITSGSVDVRGNEILICDPNLKRLTVYNIDLLMDDIVPYWTIEHELTNLSHWIRQARWGKNGSIIAKDATSEMRYGIYEADSIHVIYSDYPKAVTDEEENIAVWDYFSQWKFKPDHSKMVTTTYIGSLIEIFDTSNIVKIKSQKVLPIHEPIYNLAQGAVPKWITSSEKTTIGFEDLYVSDNFIYILAYGINVDKMINHNPSIYVLSWEGDPLSEFTFSDRIQVFGVDETEDTIYAVVLNEGNMVMKKYKMSPEN